MKKLVLIFAIVSGAVFCNTASAQVRVHLGLHLRLPGVFVPARLVVGPPAPIVYGQPVVYSRDNDFYRARFNGVADDNRWNRAVYDNRDLMPDRVENDRRHLDRSDFRGAGRFGRDDQRHGRY
jgi:hypothetical protein